jgi:hypothetical protein
LAAAALRALSPRLARQRNAAIGDNAAVADGVPLVRIPDGRDQPDNAARVLACGAGVRVRKNASPGSSGA